MFKWINRGVIAWISVNKEVDSKIFFKNQILEENILPITLSKVLNYNLVDFGIKWKEFDMIIEF